MVGFELGKEIKKDGFFVLSWVWDKEKILSPHEESNPRPSDSMLQCFTTEPQMLITCQSLLICWVALIMLKIHLKKHYSATLYCWDNSVETDWRREGIEIVMQQNFAILSLLISSSLKIWQVIITWCCLYIIPYQLVRRIWILVMLQPVANYFAGCILKWNIFLASGRCRQSSQGSHGSF